MRSPFAAVLLSCLFACGDGGKSDSGEFDNGIHDAESRDGDGFDAEPDEDASLDAGPDGASIDGATFDSGPGFLCEDPLPWPRLELPLVSTTTQSLHYERFDCAGVGGGAIAPERWIETRFEQPTHAIIRLGTAGWDAVMSVRSATCAPSAQLRCVDAPTIVELAEVQGSVFVGVDGYSDGRGDFVLFGQTGPALTVPPENAECDSAPIVQLPLDEVGHNFGADRAVEIEDCDLVSPVFVPFVAQGGELTVRVEPRAGQDLSIAVLEDCGQTLACAAIGGAGFAETISDVAIGSGRATIVVGSPRSATRQGSFSIMAALDAECAADRDCPLSQRCASNLACGSLANFNATAGELEIPDHDGIAIPLLLSGPAAPPREVRLRLGIDHEFPRDLVVTLAAPGGWPKVRLRDRLDGALDSVYGRDRPASGPGSLIDFALVATASGAWTLEVEDRAPGDVGRVTGVVLEVE